MGNPKLIDLKRSERAFYAYSEKLKRQKNKGILFIEGEELIGIDEEILKIKNTINDIKTLLNRELCLTK